MDPVPACLIDGEPSALIPADDRGFAYGDGVFETIAVHQHKALALDPHLARLADGCTALGITPPSAAVLRAEVAALAAEEPRAVLKVVVTRGSGGRGYRPATTPGCRRLVARFPWPGSLDAHADSGGTALRAFLCRHPVSENSRLAGLKHLNRLDQVLASNEWPGDDYFEGLMFDGGGRLIEGTRSNVFLRRGVELATPDLSRCGVAGIVRAEVIARAAACNFDIAVRDVHAEELQSADEVLVTNSIIGVRALTQIDGRDSKHALTDSAARVLATQLRDAHLIV